MWIVRVRVRRRDELVPSFRPTAGKLMAKLQSLIVRDLTGPEAHTDVISDHIVPALVAPGVLFILALGKEELRTGGFLIAFEADNQLATLSLFKIRNISNPRTESGGNSAAPVNRFHPGGSH
jgi:hypothetical protein